MPLMLFHVLIAANASENAIGFIGFDASYALK